MAEIYYPAGKYQCRIKQQGFDTTSTGKPQFVLTFDVTAYESGDPIAQKERAYYKVLTEKTMEYFAKDMLNLGVEVTALRMLDPSTPGYTSLEGKEALMYCQHSTDQNGNPKEEWAPAFARREMKAPPPAAMSQLDMLFGRAMKSAGVTSKPAPAARPAAAPRSEMTPALVAMTDEDVPF